MTKAVIAGVATRHPGPTMHVPVESTVDVVGPYDHVQRLQADHGIIDPRARVKHKGTSEKEAARSGS